MEGHGDFVEFGDIDEVVDQLLVIIVDLFDAQFEAPVKLFVDILVHASVTVDGHGGVLIY